MRVKIFLNTVDKVKDFVNVAQRFDVDIDMLSGRYLVDGKSIMGVLSLDLSKEIEMILNGVSKSEEDKLIESLKGEGLL